MLYVSRYSNKELATGKYTAVRISVGTPRWSLGYSLDGAIKDLMPFGLLNIEDREESRKLYHEKLDRIGFGRIEKQIRELESLGKPVVLLCYEDITKGPDNWCHRTFFAEWWLKQTGEVINELPDPAHKHYDNAPLQMTLF